MEKKEKRKEKNNDLSEKEQFNEIDFNEEEQEAINMAWNRLRNESKLKERKSNES